MADDPDVKAVELGDSVLYIYRPDDYTSWVESDAYLDLDECR